MTGPAGILPIILCGGSGTRLWPLSRRSYPKQFSPLFEGGSLFGRTLRRIAGPGYRPPLLLTSAEFRFIVAEQLAAESMQATRIIIEPEMRNTAPAVCMAALDAAEGDRAADPDTLMLVLASDHLIRDEAAFHRAVAEGAAAARQGRIVTFGIHPDRPETGYGYLELPEAPGAAATDFLRFVEKPDLASAERMLASGRYLWNSGMFLFRAGDMLAAFEAHAPEVLAACRAAMDAGHHDLGFFRPGDEAYRASPSISLDYAVMERLGGGTVVPMDCGWNDLGSWATVWQESDRDAAGVATSGPAQAIDCRDSLLRAEDATQRLVGLGLEGVIAVAMPDAVLVASMDRAQDVRLAVDALKAAGAGQAGDYPRFHRPWGWYQSLVQGAGFQVKRIMVRPGGKLSLQSHRHRAEHWVVVQGTARVTIGDRVDDLGPNQSCYVPLGEVHRLENPAAGPDAEEVHLIEVQSGDYLGEDDITRYDDVYARG